MRGTSRPAIRVALLVGFAWLTMAAPVRSAEPLPPFKDDLFGYPPLTAIGDGGDSIDVDYSEARDIDGRDEIPERRVKARYVDLSPLRTQAERTLQTSAGPLQIMTAGNADTPRIIVLFIHGRNGDRRLGMNDRTFGGNFNRLKNLMTRANGLYVTADAGTFSAADATRITTLIRFFDRDHPEARLVLACASMGGDFCWDIAGQAQVVAAVDGVVMLGANNDPAKVARMRAAAGARRPPVVLAHGSRDPVFAADRQKTLYTALKGEAYPVRLISFESGTHGTPIRMIDWRDTLNWILKKPG